MAETTRTTDTFLFLESTKSGVIKGESMDASHPNEIELTAVSWGVANPNRSAGDGDWKPEFTPVTLTTYVSRASTFLMRAASDGSAFKRATISFRKSGTKASGEANGDYLQVRLYNARIVSYSIGHSGDVPAENFVLSYEKIEWVYIQQSQTGALDQKFQHGWHVGKNQELAELTLPYKGGGAKAT